MNKVRMECGWLGLGNKSVAALKFSTLLGLFATVALLFGCEKPSDSGANTTTSVTTPADASPTAPTVSNLVYHLGDTIKFSAGGGSERFRTAGWSGTEKDFTWTEGNSAQLVIPVSQVEGPLKLRMKLSGLTKAEQPFQPIAVIVNGQKIADWEVAPEADFSATIPNQVGNSITIELKIPKAFTPQSAGMGNDKRVLGVACFELSLGKSD